MISPSVPCRRRCSEVALSDLRKFFSPHSPPSSHAHVGWSPRRRPSRRGVAAAREQPRGPHLISVPGPSLSFSPRRTLHQYRAHRALMHEPIPPFTLHPLVVAGGYNALETSESVVEYDVLRYRHLVRPIPGDLESLPRRPVCGVIGRARPHRPSHAPLRWARAQAFARFIATPIGPPTGNPTTVPTDNVPPSPTGNTTMQRFNLPPVSIARIVTWKLTIT